ncbi:unnamed protein product [Owenia fusiformis]|uniref:non-specific serine/threonine protein kinase n=1 Tax=Owenia fusiformis TaxID=6347 RepID=A0A8J1UZI5_OWEFU|nr:unnamed protein product [Owenia fusiformis]
MNSVMGLGKLVTQCICARESIEIEGHRYSVLERLAEGGYSLVDLVKDKASYREFALKRIQCHSKEDERNTLKEVEYHKQFRHKNLCGCEGSQLKKLRNQNPGAAFNTGPISEMLIVLPFFKRGTLQDEISLRQHKMEYIPEKRVIQLFLGICEGLRELHSHNIAHRDIKPGNVLLSETDTPVLMDFGSMDVARVDIKTASEALALQDKASMTCTMPYRAPELFNVERQTTIDERVDIWSLGGTVYAMMYLEGPFEKIHQRGDSVALAVLGCNIRYPEEQTQYSSSLVDLIKSLLAVDPTQRPYIDWVLQRLDNVSKNSNNCNTKSATNVI